MKLLIKNGYVVDPVNKISEIRDILVENSKISQVSKSISVNADRIIDAVGKIVMPGIVDMHVHLREPGREDKETIFSGTKAALKGGVTSVLAMPNTTPAIDCAEQVGLLKNIIKNTAQANVFISGAISKERLGEELTDIVKLKKAGVIAITDDGSSVKNAALFFKALQKAKTQKILVICHCEDKALSAGGVVNLGVVSTRLGLRGIPKESEYKIVKRDIELAKRSEAKVYIAHVSCQESVEIIAQAKKKGILVTAETAPHYFSLSQEDLFEYDTNMKMNPPLRSCSDREAIKQGLKDGTIDVIASDHAPHTENEKDIEFDRAEFGVIGLETELAVAVTELVNQKMLNWLQLAEKFTLNPAKILGIKKGVLDIGYDADIAIISKDKEWVVKKESFVSKSKNSAFLGKTLKGVVDHTILAGKVVYTNVNK
jgi:dihydroorotase